MIRVLLAKPGLDGHDRGIKVIAMALRDAGFEVIYLGMRRSASEILSAAEQEDVDVVGISLLSGAHMAITQELLDERDRVGLGEIPVVVGGTVPSRDVGSLMERGVAAVFPVGSPLDAVVSGIAEVAEERRRVTR